jgi:hypothetical protein
MLIGMERALLLSSRGLLHFDSEDGGSVVLRNVGVLPSHYSLLQNKRPRLEYSST